MTHASHHILRVSVAITFLWIGILILKEPELWGAFIKPWALELLPVPAAQVMITTAILDIAIGIFLLLDIFSWLAALVGALHLFIVLVVSGIDSVTIRDIGLLGAAISLTITAWPPRK